MSCGESATLFDAPGEIVKTAWISDCERYRYVLGRGWDDALPPVLFVGLNPSTADAEQDDPTIRRCVRFARDWGYGGLVMINLYAQRETDPGKLFVGPEAFGEYGERVMHDEPRAVRARGGIVVAAWGSHPMAQAMQWKARQIIGSPLYALGWTKAHAPRHPLYMKASCKPLLWGGSPS